MSLDGVDPKLLKRVVRYAQIRAAATNVEPTVFLYQAIALSLLVIAGDNPKSPVRSQFSSLLEVFLQVRETELSEEGRKRLRQQHGVLLELLDWAWTIRNTSPETPE